jgi:hypothetical protein
MDITELRFLVNSGHFHHATYRTDFARGLHIYRYALETDGVLGFNGFMYAGMIPERDPQCKEAYALVSSSGVYENAYK